MTCVLAFVLTMGQHFASPAAAAEHLMMAVLGGLIYTLYAVAVAWLFDDRVRRLLLAEAMRAFADYLRAKAALYNPDTAGPAALRAVIDTHATLADKLQSARDSLFARRTHRMQLKRIDTLIALLDAFETVLSSDADIEALRHAAQRDLMWRLNAFVYQMADEVERLTLALRSRHGHTMAISHAEESRQLVEAVAQARAAAPDDPALHAFVATANKLVLADSYVAALATALDDRAEPSAVAASLDLDLFRQDAPRGIAPLLQQFRWRAPALRYAIRLSLAMTTGLALTLMFPRFAHANWVLLTIALIMRANYSVTRRRRWDRVTGTLIGCALAVTFINTLPAPVLLLFIVLAVGTSHAYGLVAYRVTAVGASISSLLLLHFVDPLVHPQFFERIVDTLIGAGLSWGFSFLLPSWERDDLPGTVRGLLSADAAFAEAALCLPVPEGLPLDQAAALPETLFTVWHNVFERGWATEGERVLVHGGTSGIGTMAILLGKLFGLTVIVTCGGPEKCAAALELGAAHAIDYKATDFVEEVACITHGEGVHLVLDMVAGDYVARNLKCLGDDGRHVTIAVQGGVRAEINMAEVMRRRLTLTGSTLRPRSNEFKGLLADEIHETVWPLVADGLLRPVMDRAFPLAEAGAAHARMEGGSHIGKIVLAVGE